MKQHCAYVGKATTITPFGFGLDINIENILQNKVAYKDIAGQVFGPDFPLNYAGVLPDDLFNGSQYESRSEILFDRLLKQIALSNVKIDRLFILFKNTNIFDLYFKKKYISLDDQMTLFKICLANNLKIQYEDIVIVDNTCTTGLSILAEASQGIQYGYWDNVLVCAIDLLELKETYSLSSLGALAKKVEDPSTASRPFDKARSGFVKTESASIALVTNQLNILNNEFLFQIDSFAQTNDAYRITDGRDDCMFIKMAMELAMKRSSIGKKELGFIKSHGTGTVLNDQHEAFAIADVFDKEIAITSLKGHLGHTTDASGMVETLLSAFALSKNLILPTRNCDNLEFDINLVKNIAVNTNSKYFLSNSFGFGGNNISAVVKVN